MQIAVIIFAVLGTLGIIAIFVRSRAQEGVGPLAVTDADKVQLRQLRRELGPRRVLARLLAGCGGLCLLASVTTPFRPDASGRVHWGAALWLTAAGLLLVLCAVPLVRHSK